MIRLAVSISLVLFLPGQTQAACKADPQKAILFINVNNTSQEIEKARAAACQLGETLIEVPSIASSSTQKEITRLKERYRELERSQTNSAARLQKMTEVQGKLGALTRPLLTDESLQREFRNLADQNVAVKSIVISGHDGGGEYSDELHQTTVWRSSIENALTKAYQGKPGLQGQLESILLWGCYAAAPSEVESWRQSFPSLRLIAGFDGISPSGFVQQGPDLLKDTLLRENDAIRTGDEKLFEGVVERLNGIVHTTGSFYVKNCQDQEFFYVNNHSSPSPRPLYLGNFADSLKCSGDVNQQLINLQPYISGDLDIPTDTQNSPLRDIYSFTRQNESCIETSGNWNFQSVSVGLLVFFEDVKKNFASAEGSLIEEANNEIQSGDLPPSLKNQFWPPDLKNMAGKSRKDVLDEINLLNGMTQGGHDPKFPKASRLLNDMNLYLHYLVPACMDFLEWHKYVPGSPPKKKC